MNTATGEQVAGPSPSLRALPTEVRMNRRVWKDIRQTRVIRPAGSYSEPGSDSLTLLLNTGLATRIRLGTESHSLSCTFAPASMIVHLPNTDLAYSVTSRCHLQCLSIPSARIQASTKQKGPFLRDDDEKPSQFIADKLIALLMQRIWGASSEQPSASAAFIDSAIDTLLALVLAKVPERRARILAIPCGTLSPTELAQIETFVHAHIDRQIDLDTLAATIGMDSFRFSRRFKRATGLPPYRWVLQCRLQRAKELLTHTQLSLVDIAYEVGFSSQSHLTSTFTRMIGQTPRAYRLTTTHRCAVST